ncbi:MAG: trypsin-like peptidase domain-containing protein [Oscillospiraceae bacterium]|nr:trypsin-like peptidase domain-containing protein [Oscillospiraceae bacterium]
MYDDYNYSGSQDQSSGEYHYSYRSDASGFQPQPPAPVNPRKKRAGKIVAAVLCGTLLIGGAFGAGWYINSQPESGPAAPTTEEVQPDDSGSAGGELQVSGRTESKLDTVSVTGSKKLTFPEVYQANVDSCVSINSSGVSTGYNIFGQPIQRQSVSSGSGFILTADGYIATNCHVISGATEVQITLHNGKTYAAEVVGSDADYDIAVLKVDPGEDKLTPVVLGSSAALNVGEDVSTIGNPLGELTFSMSKGIVSCLDREINLQGTPFNMIQTDTLINPGNSGGPLFNCYGEVVGIVTAKTSSDGNGSAAEGLGFAIPIDDVLDLIKDIIENGQVTSRAYMGVTQGDASRFPESGMRSGSYLVEVLKGGPAEKAGLQAGDVITMLGTTTITSADDLSSAVSSSKTYKAGDTVTVTYVRNGKVYTTELTFGSTLEKPEEPTPQSAQSQQDLTDGYEDGYSDYGNMEDFFNQFFGSGYGRSAA